jgi:hypothetical protein
LEASLVQQSATGRYYTNGRAYSLEVKVEVRNKYYDLIHRLGQAPTPHQLKQEASVSDTFARKVIGEIEIYGDVKDPRSLPNDRPRGVGSKTLNCDEEAYLLDLRREKPARPLSDYAAALQARFGKGVSEGLLSEWFKNRFVFNASKKRTSNVPTDKWSDANTERYLEYLLKMLWMDPKRVKFGDEKLLKGEDFFSQEVRCDPQDGTMPTIDVDPDFRNAYSIVGVMQAGDADNAAVEFTIGEENGDSESFLMFIIDLVGIGFFRHRDIFVLDNCKIHAHGLCDILEDFLWNASGLDGNPLEVLIVWLPTRSPELNPIEKLWNTLVRRLKNMDLYSNRPRRHAAPRLSAQILFEMASDHALMKRLYLDCGYVRNW